MAETIINNSGTVVNKSSTGSISIGQMSANLNDYSKLTIELETLLVNYRKKEKEDFRGIEAIEKAIDFSRTQDETNLKSTIIKFFSTYMKKLAEELSLKFLVEYIINICK